jgi:putative membrane protein
MKRTLKDYGLITHKGMAMGAADVVPGVSGGTIAFITGIYQELIDSIKSISPKTFGLHPVNLSRLVFTRANRPQTRTNRPSARAKIAEFWTAVNGTFLISLLLGIGVSIFSLARITTHLLVHHPVLIWAFFFGLVLASTWFVLKSVGAWNRKTVTGFILGMSVAFYITVAVPAHTPESLPFIFLYGAIAICAMILPGISGSFILVLLDKYFYIMDAVKELKFGIMITFACGAAVGIVFFSRILSFLLRKYHDVTIAVLSGFMFGSLNKVWPWKETLSTYTDSHGAVHPLIETNVLPGEQLWAAVALALAGFAFVYALEKISARKK